MNSAYLYPMRKLTFIFILLPAFLYAQHNWNAVKPVRLSTPDWNIAWPSQPVGNKLLTQVSMKPNQITDGDNWMAENDLTDCFWSPSNRYGYSHPPLPAAFPASFNGQELTLAWHHKGVVYEVFSDSLLFVADSVSGKVICAYDFGAYMYSPNTVAGERMFTQQEIRFARLEDSVLYVAGYHNTYAKSSGKQNGYLNAIDIRTHKINWRSHALLNNSSTFVLHNGYLICGYGFTAEPDFVYVLETRTGKVAAVVPVKSGPELIIQKGNRLYVRTYNTDYVFEMKLPAKK
jgi:hypothetical protein